MLSRYSDVIMARMLNHCDLKETRRRGRQVPVINGCCNPVPIPCQALGDLMTVREIRGKLRGRPRGLRGHSEQCVQFTNCRNVPGPEVRITTVTPEVNKPSEDEEHLPIRHKDDRPLFRKPSIWRRAAARGRLSLYGYLDRHGVFRRSRI